MKKLFNILVMITLCLLLTSCGEVHNVIFEVDGNAYGVQSIKDGKLLDVPLEPTKDQHDFKGWYKDGQLYDFNQKVKESFTLKAKFEKYHYTYIFKDSDGTVLKEVNDEIYAVIEAPESPKKPGYIFTGWDKDFMYLTEDVTITATYKKLVLEGTKVSILGDSISTFYSPDSSMNSYYSGTNEFYYPLYSSEVKSVEKTWWYQVLQSTNTVLGVNESLSGSDMYYSGSKNTRINNLGLNGDPGIVIIFLGTNDNVNGNSNENFKNAYESTINKIKSKYPGVVIFCCTLGYSAYTGYNYTEARRQSYNQIIKELVEKYDLGLVDISSVQNGKTYNQYLGDNLHPNAAGMVAYAEAVTAAINAYYGIE